MYSSDCVVPRSALHCRLLLAAATGGAAWAVGAVGGGAEFAVFGLALGCVCMGLLTSWSVGVQQQHLRSGGDEGAWTSQ